MNMAVIKVGLLLLIESAACFIQSSTKIQRKEVRMKREEEEVDASALLRSVDTGKLLQELEGRGYDGQHQQEILENFSSHTVGRLRQMGADGEKRKQEIDAALLALGTESRDLLPGPPLKAYTTYLRPRSTSQTQTVENAAHQIAFLQRHEKARRETQLRNTDTAARARRAAGLKVHPLIFVLDNIRSAENVGSIFRTADCARSQEIITCGFTPNPLSTSKLQKTAFGTEQVVASRHFDSTKNALLELKQNNVQIWALETHDSAVSHTSAPLQTLDSKQPAALAILLGNEVTGVDLDLLPLVDAIVEIPTFGSKNSMNVAVAAGIVAFDVLRRWNFIS